MLDANDCTGSKVTVTFTIGNAERDWANTPTAEDDIDFAVGKLRGEESEAELRWYGRAGTDPQFESPDKGKLSARVVFRERVSRLGDALLEQEAHNLFRALGCLVVPGKRGSHDGVIYYPPELPSDEVAVQRSAPIEEGQPPPERQPKHLRFVLEVKGISPNSWGNLKYLRQLDDWVFEMSGEESLRKAGPIDNWALLTHGVFSQSARVAIRRHKGVFVFNPKGRTLSEALAPKWPPNVVEFAEKRGFCLITFPELICCVASYKSHRTDAYEILSAIDTSHGVAELPEIVCRPR